MGIRTTTATATATAILAVLLAGCSTAAPEPDPYAIAFLSCLEAQERIIEINQPDNLEAWRDEWPGMCEYLADQIGEDEFTEQFNDPMFVRYYIEERTS